MVVEDFPARQALFESLVKELDCIGAVIAPVGNEKRSHKGTPSVRFDLFLLAHMPASTIRKPQRLRKRSLQYGHPAKEGFLDVRSLHLACPGVCRGEGIWVIGRARTDAALQHLARPVRRHRSANP